MDIKIYIFIGLITLLNINVNARNIKKINSHFHREYDMHDEHLARDRSLKISHGDPKDADNKCECKNGFCEGNEKGKMVCKCPPEWGPRTSPFLGDVSCKKCNCGKDANCTIAGGMFSDTISCICKEGYNDVNGFCSGDCSGEPCKNGGNCKIVGKDIACDCVAPYFGDFCEKKKSSLCSSNPCKNGGTCDDSAGKVVCKCVGTFIGAFCEKDACTPNPCKNGGKCIVKEGRPNCTCAKGYSGNNCENDACTPNPCKNGGKCQIKQGIANCTCAKGYSGKYCENEECTVESGCEYGEKCVDGICKCSYDNAQNICDNVEEVDCSKEFSKCKTSEGICKYNKNGTIRCDCGEKIFHPVKEVCAEECTVETGCEYGEKCVDGICKCSYDNAQNICDNVEEVDCSKEFSKCKTSGGICKYNKNGTIRCDCGEKIFHPVKEECAADRCKLTCGTKDEVICEGDKFGIEDVKCNCKNPKDSYDPTDKMCKVDRCKLTCGSKDDVICEGDKFGIEDVKCNCKNTKNSFDPTDKMCKVDKCKEACETRYGVICEGDRFGTADVKCSCKDIDKSYDSTDKTCKVDRCKLTCGSKDDVICESDKFGIEDVKCNCKNTKNSYDPTDKMCKVDKCKEVCGTRYGVICEGDRFGKADVKCNCKDIDKSYDSTDKTCKVDKCKVTCGTKADVICEGDKFGTADVKCKCKYTDKSYDSIDQTCKDVRPSTSVTFTTPPSVSDKETSTLEEFKTTLSKIFQTSTAISRRKEISSTDWGFTTTTGPPRTIPDLCYLHHCRNRGVCRVINYRPRCLCLPPFTGDFCEKDPCTKSPCVNGGTCRIQNTSFNCSCNEPFTGDFCEKDPCTDNPCQNGGTCLLSGNIFKCICKEAFSGDRCESSAVTTTFILQLAILSLMAVSFIVLMSCLLLRRCKGRRC